MHGEQMTSQIGASELYTTEETRLKHCSRAV